jgi:uncharacterized protein (DUF4415 family)
MVPRVITANALVSGDGDSVIIAVTTGNSTDYNKMVDRQTFYKKIYQIDKRTMLLSEVLETSVSDGWLRQRNILSLRQDAFYTWETFTAAALARCTRYKWDQFDQLATRELDKCDPSNNQFTMMLEEYARVMEIPVDQTYKELKLRIESDNIQKFRIQAMTEKWKDKINNATELDEMNHLRKDMIRDFWLNSSI